MSDMAVGYMMLGTAGVLILLAVVIVIFIDRG